MRNRRGRGPKGQITLDIAKLERKKIKLERRAHKMVAELMAISDLIVALKKAKETELGIAALPSSLVVKPEVAAASVPNEVPNAPTEG